MDSNVKKKNDDICKRISLNIPSVSRWSWDEMFNTALVVFDKSDMDVIYIPITQEFDAQWDFTTIENAPSHFYTYFNRVFGVVPGQKIFTSTDTTGTILFAVWWPWGDGKKISLRVGLFDGNETNQPDQFKEFLRNWFHIQDPNSDS